MKAPVLAIALGPHRGPDGPGDEPDEGSDEEEAFDSLAEDLGIPEEKRESAYESLKAFVRACVKTGEEGGYSKDEG